METILSSKLAFYIGSTYGSGLYGSSTYNGAASQAPANVQIGPVTLPVTGSELMIIAGIAAIAIGAGVFVWLRQRRMSSRAQTSDLSV